IEGEVSGFRPSTSGHWYFTLKDRDSQISAVMFRFAHTQSSYIPKNGDKVLIRGSVDVYEPRGTYQIICQSIRKSGDGDILLELEKRKAYYQSLGYFDLETKKQIPKHPSRVGIVTAPGGAAVEDMLNTLKKRAPSLDVVIYPCLVQGESAAEDIAAQIDNANMLPMCDVLIVGRGGGSKEDLLPFSDPLVIEAIHRSELPVISAVGHEIDYSLSDYAADARAITPTEGASMASEGIFRDRQELGNITRILSSVMKEKLMDASSHLVRKEELDALVNAKVKKYQIPFTDHMKQIISSRFSSAAMKVSFLSDSLTPALSAKAERERMHLDAVSASNERDIALKADRSSSMVKELSSRSLTLMNGKYSEAKARLASASAAVQALSPLEVLKRGYAIATLPDGRAVRSSDEVKAGDILSVRLMKGIIRTEVLEEK
ncbi:MAG: exodeoxyribonuclease VII large subunit, partial [Bullifex sp.]